MEGEERANEEAGGERNVMMWKEVHLKPLSGVAPDCSLLLGPIVCDSISASAWDHYVTISVISVRTVHLQPEPAVLLEQAFSQRTWGKIEFSVFPDVVNN